MRADPVLTLTTDFGYDDPFAGVMKGVILKINPAATIVDISHGIRPHDIREAAYTIGMNFQYFPSNTIHLVVVDPGVGSGRRPLLVEADHHYFIGPDNGVFSYIYRMCPHIMQIVHITSAHYFLSSVSPTFQGRDIFAPVAAWFSRGLPMERFGEPVSDYQIIPMSVPKLSAEGLLVGEVIHIDRFGNAITNITTTELTMLPDFENRSPLRILLKEQEVPLQEFYAQGEDSRLCSLINSSGHLEFFMFQGRAADQNKIAIGDPVSVMITRG
ncbi:MAG: hypothetical protein C0402_03005 [Thermodesulfovibrio sp.]|nr:hypothetical protein [Thermodesulfovibrio sp.]